AALQRGALAVDAGHRPSPLRSGGFTRRSLSVLSTGPAIAPAAMPVGVGFVVWVTSKAMRHEGLHGAGTAGVLRRCDRLQMLGIDAARFAAQVVKGQVIRNRSDEARVRPAVREQGRLVDAETGVSRREEASGPEPAPVLLLIDFGPEPGIVIAVDEGHLGWRPVLL